MSKITTDQALMALSPLDGRYSHVADSLSGIFSEYALIKNRVFVEIKWLEKLFGLLDYSIEQNTAQSKQIEEFGGINKVKTFLEQVLADFSLEDAKTVKEIEQTTNHDVKACELFVAQKLVEAKLDTLQGLIHICCTSEDVTNLAYALMLIEGKTMIVKKFEAILSTLRKLTIDEADTHMLSHTHGQAATPTTFGKEMGVFLSRLETQLAYFKSVEILGKFNGASGNYAAGAFAFPLFRWGYISTTFISSLHPDIHPVLYTTQIEPHDYISRLLNELKLAMQIIRDLDQDMWSYISRGYLTQKFISSEVGSSTMPHKVNPITFENSESNIKLLTGLCNALADELPRSRMQRDLSDSSLLRNLGLVFGYATQAIEQTHKGLNIIEVNKTVMHADIAQHVEIYTEAVQTILRARGVTNAYERLKKFARGQNITYDTLFQFLLEQPELPMEDIDRIFELVYTGDYVGFSKNLALAAAGQIDIGEGAIILGSN